ncbi:hypothetical protein THAOC_15275, partial [Thalassiosira oceanica]
MSSFVCLSRSSRMDRKSANDIGRSSAAEACPPQRRGLGAPSSLRLFSDRPGSLIARTREGHAPLSLPRQLYWSPPSQSSVLPSRAARESQSNVLCMSCSSSRLGRPASPGRRVLGGGSEASASSRALPVQMELLVAYHDGGALQDEVEQADRDYRRSYEESIRLQAERHRAVTELAEATRRYERECAKIRFYNDQATRKYHAMWRKRQLTMARTREIFGEEGARRREAVYGVLRDCLDRVAVKDEAGFRSGSRALASASRGAGDDTRASVAATLGRMVDTVDRR